MLLGPEGTGLPAPCSGRPCGVAGRGGCGGWPSGDHSWPGPLVMLGVRAGVGALFENCTVDASIFDLLWQVFKSIRWMPWHQEPKKDVVACDKPRGAGKRAVIRGCPNGETRPESCLVTRA